MHQQIEHQLVQGHHCLAIESSSCLSSFFSSTTFPLGHILYISLSKRPRHPAIKNVKYVSPMHGIAILARHHATVDTVVLRDVDRLCPEYYVLFHLFRYWKQPRVFLLSPSLPSLSFMQSFFPNVVPIEEVSSEEEEEDHDPFLYLEEEVSPLHFHYQRHRWEEWISVQNIEDFPRIVVYVACRYQCEIIKLYFECLYPHRLVLTEFPSFVPNSVILVTMGTGDDVLPDEFADLVVDFGFYQKQRRSYYGEVLPCPQSMMVRRQRKACKDGIVFRMMTRQQFEERPLTLEIPEEEWKPWAIVLLASLKLPFSSILYTEKEPLARWNVNLETSTKKRLKTLLQYPFSIRVHLMLERCRHYPMSLKQRLWTTLAVTLIHWFDHYPRLVMSRRSFYDLHYIYGNDDELFIHLRIAAMMISESPLMHLDFIHPETTAKKFSRLFQKALEVVYGRLLLPKMPMPLLEMADADMDFIRHFLMTDPRIERFYPLYGHLYSFWSSMSYLNTLPFSQQQCALLLNTTRVTEGERITLWTLMPRSVVDFQTNLLHEVSEKEMEREKKHQHKAFFNDRVIRYFNEVLIHAPWP